MTPGAGATVLRYFVKVMRMLPVLVAPSVPFIWAETGSATRNVAARNAAIGVIRRTRRPLFTVSACLAADGV